MKIQSQKTWNIIAYSSCNCSDIIKRNVFPTTFNASVSINRGSTGEDLMIISCSDLS